MAEAPLFGLADDCVEVADKQEQSSLHITYTVAFDDVELMQGDIAVSDAKTHQFFAFRGALFPHDFSLELFPFEPAGAAPAVLPSWITTADVKRAARATNTLDGTAFSEADIPEGAVLDANAGLLGSYVRVTADDARVPITWMQSLSGVDWMLADVEPGLYTFAGYVFSPPYNGWAERAQLVEIVDGGEAGPAARFEKIEGGLFPYQGRRVRGCVAVPEGSQLKASFTVVERPDEGWIEWLPSTPLASGELELCFRDPRPELTGSARLRFDLTAPDGTTRSFYTPDTVTVLPGSGRCTESETVCCPQGSEPEPPSAGAGEPDSSGSDGGASSNPGGRDASTHDPTGEDGGPRDTDRSDSGCAVGGWSSAAAAARHGALLGVWLAWSRLRRARRARG